MTNTAKLVNLEWEEAGEKELTDFRCVSFHNLKFSGYIISLGLESKIMFLK